MKNTITNNTHLNFTKSLKVDLHSHILPALDDGLQSLSELYEVISKYISLGFEKIIVTPHNHFPIINDANKIFKTLTMIKNFCADNNLNIKLEASSEYFADDFFLELLNKNEVIPIKNKYLLIEFDLAENFYNILFYVEKIKEKGYTPIIAHPERYVYFNSKRELFFKLKEYGALFQVNWISYNYLFTDLFVYLAENKLISFLGSDTHSIVNLKAIENNLMDEKFMNLILSNNIINSTLL